MNWLKRTTFGLAIFGGIYLIGPQPSDPDYSSSMPIIPSSAVLLEEYIHSKEVIHKLKPGNEAKIIWANDSTREKTEYAIVYLHGFSASQEEGNPVHGNIAKQFGCNLYLSRLADHGIDTSEQLLNFTAEKWFESCKEALAIGKQLGNKVILMGTSTGGTTALQLAAMFPGDVVALILLSPNIAINDPNAWMLNYPWGLQMARLVKGSKYNTPKDERPVYKQYWNSPYRLEAAVQLEELIESTMKKAIFEKVKQPVLTLCYYKNEKEQDSVVKVSAIRKMMDEVSTPQEKKWMIELPNAGNHVLTSPIKSKDVPAVQSTIQDFLIKVLGIEPKQKNRFSTEIRF